MIPLVNTIAEMVDKKMKSFKIITQSDFYYLSAAREKEMNHWIYSINKHAKMVTRKHEIGKIGEYIAKEQKQRCNMDVKQVDVL